MHSVQLAYVEKFAGDSKVVSGRCCDKHTSMPSRAFRLPSTVCSVETCSGSELIPTRTRNNSSVNVFAFMLARDAPLRGEQGGAMAASSSSAGAPAAADTPERGPTAAPLWVQQTYQRYRERKSWQFISDARGPARWNTAESLRVERDAGEPFAADDDERLRSLGQDYYLVRYNLGLASASFEPQRATIMLCGRPVQASGKHHSRSSACHVFHRVHMHT